MHKLKKCMMKTIQKEMQYIKAYEKYVKNSEENYDNYKANLIEKEA